MNDRIRLIVIKRGESVITELVTDLDDSEYDITVMECSDHTSPDEMLYRLVGEQQAGSIVASLVILTNESDLKKQHSLIPICAHCKRIRDNGDLWEQPETYFSKRFHVNFTHGICPRCAERLRIYMKDIGPRQEND